MLMRKRKAKKMYIEIHDWKEFEQKVLYFKLNNSINMNTDVELSYKMSGIYAIYKDDLCLYVGQSSNLASRVATHLSGKYQTATHIYAWKIEDIGFPDYRTYIKEIKEQILDKSEKYLMSILKPIENIDIDMGYIIYDSLKPKFNFQKSSNFTFQINESFLQITDSHPYILEEFILKMETENLGKYINEISPIKDFYLQGVKNED